MCATPIDVGNRLELFVDYFLIDKLEGARLQLNHPTPANVALRFDQPWEGAFCGYCTVIKDGDLYRLYYRGWPSVNKGVAAVYCYAESRDGVAFTRPSLGIHEFKGRRDNNIILVGPGTHSFSPFLDRNPAAREDQRFKALAQVKLETGAALLALVSADGIHWSKLRDEPVLTQGAFDSQNVAFWSEHEGCYVSYYRTFHGAPDPTQFKGVRTISRATSDDFIHWTDPVEMDYGDTAREELYTNQTHPYFRAPHIYLAFPKRFVPNRQTLSDEEAATLGVIPPYHTEVSDGVFMTTRGGNRYERTFMEAFVRPGEDRANWVSRTNMSTLNVVPTGAREMSLYYQQRYATTSHFLRRYTLRTDGFVSVNAPYGGGELLTKPFTFRGSQLAINYATSAPGSLRVEVQDQSGKPCDGFALADCREIYGDEIERVVDWKRGSDLAGLNGKPIRLRFAMKDADLYSLCFR